MAKATILIPTYNRPECLQRLLDYYHDYGSDFDIVIADSSSEENKKLNRKIILSFPDLNIQYIDKYPEDTDPYHKWADMANYAKEKYCVFCGDDDFIVPNGINQSVAFLEKNPDFTVAHGRYIWFWLDPKKSGEKQFCWQINYSNQSITFPESQNRLIKHLSECGLPTVYAVYRTIFLKMIYREVLNSGINTQTQSFEELLPSMITLIYGKMKCLDDVLYMARQMDSDRNYRNEWLTLTGLMEQSKYDEEYAKFKQCLVFHLHKESQLNMEELKKIIDGAMSMHIKRHYSPHPKQVLINKVKDILTSFVPDWMYKKIRLLYKKIFFPKETDDFFVSLEKHSYKCYGDFDKIRSQVISSAESSL